MRSIQRKRLPFHLFVIMLKNDKEYKNMVIALTASEGILTIFLE